MKKFIMCKSCEDEYKDPLKRRYHAQPISCNECGPKLSSSIKEAATQIKNSKIVCIKGLGGFHIVCDARDEKVLKRLREAKNRPTKPFAIMCKDIEQVESIAEINAAEKKLL